MAKLIGQNVTISYRLGGVQDGTTNFSGAVIAATCLARSVRVSESTSTVDLAALCDTTTKMQTIRTTGTLTLELYVDAAPLFQLSKGYYFEVSITPVSGGTAIVYTGVIIRTEYSVEMDQAQIETVEVQLGVN